MLGSKAPTEYQGFSEELTERAWLQLVRSCALHTRCCPNFWKGGAAGCGWSEEYREYRNGAPRSPKTKRGRKSGNNLYMIFKLENTSGDS